MKLTAVDVLSMILFLLAAGLIIDAKANVVSRPRLEEKRTMTTVVHSSTHFSTNEPLAERLESEIGRGYQMLGHKISDIGLELEQKKKTFAVQIADLYSGPIANQTGILYENLQYGYGRTGEKISLVLDWLGRQFIGLGHLAGQTIQSSFYTIGDLLGSTVDRTEHFLGEEFIQGSEQVRAAAISLERTSHQDGEEARQQLIESAPELQRSMQDIIETLGQKIHQAGRETEFAGEVMKEHRLIDTLTEEYQKT